MNTNAMMHSTGRVIRVDDDGTAQLVMNRKSACSGCDTGKIDKCRSCLTGSKITATAINCVHAGNGDIVSVSMHTSKVLKGAAALYLIPVACLLSGSFVALRLSSVFQFKENTLAMIGGFFGLALGVCIVKYLSVKMNTDNSMIPKISKIIHSSEKFRPENFPQLPRSRPGCR